VTSPSDIRAQVPAVVLLSGGLDSSTVLAIASREARQHLYALSFAYGQRHVLELDCARRQAARFGVVDHQIIDLAQLGKLVAPASSLIASSELSVPAASDSAHDRDRDRDRDHDRDSVPNTYVPARNTLFLSYALAWAEVLGARDIWIGVNAVDYSGYPDCRPTFVQAFEETANLGTKLGADPGARVRIHAPLIALEKAEIIARGHSLGVDYADTLSCYDPDTSATVALACGRCESCSLRRRGFLDAGVPDPTRYT